MATVATGYTAKTESGFAYILSIIKCTKSLLKQKSIIQCSI